MTIFMPFDNARIMDFHVEEMGFVPIVALHYIENAGNDDLVFLEMFAHWSSWTSPLTNGSGI